MAGWTKEQYDNAYSFRVERYLGGHPNTRPEVRINYHEHFMRPIMVERWRNFVQVLTPAITLDDFVLIVGAGFGWGVRALRDRVGCSTIGTDNSTYVQGEKENDDASEIRAKISAVGLDPSNGRGLEILNFCRTTGARAKEIVLDEDMVSQASRSRIKAQLGGKPTWIIVEDIVDDAMTDAEITTLATRLNNYIARKVWTYTPTPARSAQDLATLSGHRVITTAPYELVSP